MTTSGEPSGREFETPRLEQFSIRAQLEQLRGCGCGCGCGSEGGAGGGAGLARTQPEEVATR